MNIKYDRIAEGIIKSAVQSQLRGEIKKHCQKQANTAAQTWLNQNRSKLNAMICAEVSKNLDAQVKEVTNKAAKAITLRAPVARRSYW